MPRLRQTPRDEVTDPEVRARYERMFGERDPVVEPGTATGSPGDWWTVFALVPDVMLHATRGFALYSDEDRILPPELRELAQTRAGWARGSQFVFSQHSKAARNAGVSEEKVAAIPAWTVAGCFDEVERAVLAYTDCLVLAGGRVPDDVFGSLRAGLGDEAILELTYITCMYEMHATICRALRLEFDDRPDPVVEVPAPEGGAAYDLDAALGAE